MGFSIFKLLAARLSQEEMFELKDAFVKHICSLSQPQEIIFFGSYARGEMTTASDLDIAVLFDKNEDIAAAKNAILTTKRPVTWAVDYLFFSRTEFEEKRRSGGVCQIIADEGISVYTRKSN